MEFFFANQQFDLTDGGRLDSTLFVFLGFLDQPFFDKDFDKAVELGPFDAGEAGGGKKGLGAVFDQA